MSSKSFPPEDVSFEAAKASNSIVVTAQYQLFPRKVLRIDPQPEKTADTIGEAEADDTFRYIIKRDAELKPVRASEWITTSIAERVGFAVPTPAVLELDDGSTVFGSRKIYGLGDRIFTLNYLSVPQMPPFSNVPLVSTLSAIYAFDLALNNGDRHLGNYMFVTDNDIARALLFDFSRCLLYSWPWLSFADVTSHTRTCGKYLRTIHGFDLRAAENIINRLAMISSANILSATNEFPSSWLSDPIKTDFINWWDSNEKSERLNALLEGLKNGSLL